MADKTSVPKDGGATKSSQQRSAPAATKVDAPAKTEKSEKSILGDFRLEKKLGQGAMGGVYMGKHRVLEVHHAIKVIHPKLLGDQTLVERFLREARNTAKLKHMNIVQVVGADQVDGIYYLAMEFVQGKTLEQIMRSPGLSREAEVLSEQRPQRPAGSGRPFDDDLLGQDNRALALREVLVFAKELKT